MLPATGLRHPRLNERHPARTALASAFRRVVARFQLAFRTVQPRSDYCLLMNIKPGLSVFVVVLSSILATAAVRSNAVIAKAPTLGPQESILDDPTRPAGERARDAGSKPLEVYEWLGIREGMVVVDLIPYFGYNSHILARLVGPSGRVLAVGADDESQHSLTTRFEAAGIDNVEVHQLPHSVPDASVDVLLSVRNVHDMYIPEMVASYGMPREEIFAQILRMLKPGGIFGVVDARGPGPGVDEHSHRIEAAIVIADLETAGFELVGQSEILANPDDAGEVFGEVRTNIDRFLLRFQKPVR